MGTGRIAGAMVAALQTAGAPVTAVGSRSPDAARGFADRFGIPGAVDPHEAVAERDDVDIVYVATTNDWHAPNTLAAIAGGKAVLCEKPIGMDTDEAESMFVAADQAGVFLMEGMWMRFNPFFDVVADLVLDGVIGDLRHIAANLSYRVPTDPSRRWLDPVVGGGALLDLGIYPLSLVHYFLGLPEEFSAIASPAETGVDTQMNVVSLHEDGRTSAVFATFDSDSSNEAVLSGTEGRIRIHSPMHHSAAVSVERDGDVIETIDTSYDGRGFQFEIAHVEACIAEGLTTSPLRPPEDTIEVMAWMDAISATAFPDVD